LDSDWPRISEAKDGNPNLDVSSENLAYVMYTSGSTGRPKGVALEHRSAVTFVHWANQVFTPHDLAGVLFSTSACFDLSVFEVFVTLSAGGAIIVAANALELPSLSSKNEVTLINTVPSAMAELVQMRGVPSSVRTVNLAGEALPDSLVERIYATTKVENVYNLYGPTEATTYSTYTLVPRGRPVTIGQPITNTQAYILDARLQPVPVGVTGELCIGGDGLARSYLNRPELTAEKFIAHPFSTEPGARIYRTGDLARYRPDGNIEFLGRMDHQVKIRGFRIELEEIEAAVQEHIGVSQCVVVAPEDAAGEKRLVAYVVPVDTHGAPAIAELRDFLKQKLPDYMVPAAFVMLQNLPLTPNGKINRKALAERDVVAARFGRGQQFVAPVTLLELKLTQIWQQILGVSSVGVRDNFFDLGGHSLLAVRLISEIRKWFDQSIPLPVLFQNPTIEGMARVLREERHANSAPELIPLHSGRSPGKIFFLDAGVGLCRLAQRLNGCTASFATVVPLSRAAFRAATPGGEKSELPSLEELAAAHAALIRSQQPSGPFVLAGYSFGGLLAFEVAHQLQREGRQVEMILLLDSMAMVPPWWQKLKMLTVDRVRCSVNFRARQLWSRMRASAAKKAKRLNPASKSYAKPEPDCEDVNLPFGDVPFNVLSEVYENAWRNYRFHQLDSRAVLFRARDNALYHLYEIDSSLGWNNLFTRGLEIVEVPGDHLSLLKVPHVLTLAQHFQEYLESGSGTCGRESTGRDDSGERRAYALGPRAENLTS
jgi:amino acid adenylation domain-containing protein